VSGYGAKPRWSAKTGCCGTEHAGSELAVDRAVKSHVKTCLGAGRVTWRVECDCGWVHVGQRAECRRAFKEHLAERDYEPLPLLDAP
jgi:hypothetical protein